ncbi:16S rRNA (cytosine(967)-C(5))-methyltransferase RsmB [Acinetobacter qingfengensis]|uniref:16S rRNA (cytosine(967)-C(5))-methyltransferase n=1 Tax=Acinetobacter qingfengensis TaxID=1262585 RepID=A0A1E7QWU2_9GAMM|nr:16S rRNA (cytosine(967)-C(5))-methyltransferase RsmB [Acinetobacter qingfengensis]KAA8731328.1 16S rRNA (cytosine(967)-C(5))-methyltransferase RsmB [Acinetobacter qingfengensis]OEY91426.1 16S rRNA (cytosine(967)-C(5))-methyltransferase [Acinetobacter qingfengensis]
MSQHPVLNLRAQLIRLLVAVQQGQSLAQIQNKYFEHIAVQDKALWHELSLGVLRQWFALKQVTLPMLQKPVSDIHIETALYVGLYQLLCTRIADHAAISETVNAVKQLGFESASGLVNAILRRATREREQLIQQLQQAHGLPSWLYKRLKKDWKAQFEDLTQQLKGTAPLTLRINQRQIGRDAYLKKLQQQQIAARICQWSEVGIVLEQSVHIPDLPGFEQGWFSVQDEHAQLCAMLLPDLNQQLVVDACAAPGGKTAHVLEKYHPKQMLALDFDSKRLQRVEENLKRLQLNNEHVRILAADATNWQAQEAVDCIILDAPCSAIGVLRRHPDIRLLRQSSDIAKIVVLQQQILQHMWQQLKIGGHLLYITCSILKAENEQQMQTFFAQHTHAKEIQLNVSWGIEQQYGRQLLPAQGQGDGFYYCLIQKTA